MHVMVTWYDIGHSLPPHGVNILNDGKTFAEMESSL
jgi:hypothetical protein